MQLKLIDYARQYIRPKHDFPKSREARKKVSIGNQKDVILTEDIMQHVNYYLSLLQELKKVPEKVERNKKIIKDTFNVYIKKGVASNVFKFISSCKFNGQFIGRTDLHECSYIMNFMKNDFFSN